MDLFASIDLYCERTAPGLWAEPLNALSNLAFLVAAIVLWRDARDTGNPRGMRVLASLVGLVAVCSGLFHLFGTVWGMWLDNIGIALFILTYLYRYLRALPGWPTWACWMAMPAYLLADRGVARVGNLGLNGSETYLLPCALLAGLAIWTWRLPFREARRWLSLATVTFPVSLALRTLDMQLCAAWPAGSHFAWHVLNAFVLYCCVKALRGANPDHRAADGYA